MKGRNEVLVGSLLLVALIIGIAGTIWLVRGGLTRGYPLYSVFRWGQNLKVGQPVVLSGVPIGYVSKVDLKDDGHLVVSMAIQKGRKVPANGRAVVEAVGIFGDAQVAIQATPSPQSFSSGDTVPAGVPAAGIPELTAKADSVATVAVNVSRKLQSELIDAGALRDMRQAIGRTNALVAQIASIAAEQSRQLSATQAQVRGMLSAVDTRKLDSTLSNARTVSANAAALTDSLRVTTSQINALLVQVKSGQGTAGKLLTDSLLYADIRRLVTRVDSLTLDFKNNPGKYTKGVVRIF
ncbi:Mammalian cell entry related domain protein [Gemmatirosa kalamazoonensis]|uniref:Mammalian cell entry related domain protein n=1 Tax=Gemmatirosa kalamazoonensis TaxID=861299 RepID=W0RMM3_9BACT|nr:MlaD family protein [Gemmatirosa kalamazoonensis]AHG91702.1 Mammalian cell entry related domain protein [Gemmatirosa kalamazoonensis]